MTILQQRMVTKRKVPPLPARDRSLDLRNKISHVHDEGECSLTVRSQVFKRPTICLQENVPAIGVDKSQELRNGFGRSFPCTIFAKAVDSFFYGGQFHSSLPQRLEELRNYEVTI